ncbi:WD-containing protein [Giardia lamblia P15]|uniref:WD-containing protein n=1 Tax=Giardia intestinalis (strain P15) TaxID=658858 RepID=E1F732_GIAIA|nr:WD-containing protein [Giardia lamblia P15]
MSLLEDQSSSCVHASAKPAVPERVGQRFAVINMMSKYETQAGPQPTDTIETFAGSEVSFHVKPYIHVVAQGNASQLPQSPSQRESSLGEALFNLSSARIRDLDSEWDANFIQLEPMADVQTKLSSCSSCLLPVIPCNLKREKARTLYNRLKLTPYTNSPISQKNRKYYVWMSQLMVAHHGPIWASEFSRDLSFFATAGQNGFVKIWKYIGKAQILTEPYKPSLDASTLIHAKGLEPLSPIYENLSKESLSQHTDSPAPNHSSKLSTHRLSKATEIEANNTTIVPNNFMSILEPLDCKSEDFDDESTSSLTDEKPYEVITRSQLQEGGISPLSSVIKLRPSKAQFSQLSQTVSQHSTLCCKDIPSNKPSIDVQSLTPDKLMIDFSSKQSALENNRIPFFLPAIRVFKGHIADVISCSWSKSNFLATGSLDKTVKIWSPIKGSCLEILTHSSPVTCVLFHPLHEQFLYTGTSAGDVYQWDVIGKRKVSWTAPQMVTSIAFTKNKFAPPTGVIIVGTAHGKIYILVADTLRPIYEFQTYTVQHTKQTSTPVPRILALSVIDETNELLVSTADSQIKRYCLLSMLQTRKYKAHTMSGILGAAVPRILALSDSKESTHEKTYEENVNRFVIIGDDKGSICMYPDGSPTSGRLKSIASKSFIGISSHEKQPKQKAYTTRSTDTTRSCLKINLPSKTVCTTINVIQSNQHVTNTKGDVRKSSIVVTTADGSVICIDI